MPRRSSTTIRAMRASRRRAVPAVALGVVALAVGSGTPPALGARNHVPDAFVAAGGCSGISVFGFGGFVPTSGLGQCSVRAGEAAALESGAQGRIEVDAPAGTLIARVRDWQVWVDARTGAVTTEAWWNTSATSGDTRAADYGTGSMDRSLGVLVPPDPDGARSFFLMARSHAFFGTPQLHFMALNAGSVDPWDYEPPTLVGASVDGGAGWSRDPSRVVRFTIGDNLGARGLGLARIQSGGTILDDQVSPAPGARARTVDVGRLGDGEHAILAVVLNSGSGDLPAVWAAPQTVRLDRTAPTAPTAVTGIPAGWTAPTVSPMPHGATDAHSGIAGHEWRTSPDGGHSWSEPDDAPVPPGIEGRLALQVRSRDGVGLTSAWSDAGTLSIDGTPPELALDLPPGRITGKVTVRAQASDARSGIREVTFARRLLGRDTWTPVPVAAADPHAAELDADALTRGTHELRVVAVDQAGNERDLTREIVVDGSGATVSPEGTRREDPAPSAPESPSARSVAPTVASAAASSAAPSASPHLAIDPRALVRLNPGVAARTGGDVRFRVRHPSPARLRIAGALRDESGAPLAGRAIEVTMGGRPVARGRTEPDGTFTLAVAPRGVGPLALRVDGQVLRTWPVTVTPHVRVSASAQARVGRRWRVRGTVSPSPLSQGARRHLALLFGVDTRRCPELRDVVAGGRVFARPSPSAVRRIPDRCWRLVGNGTVDARGRFGIDFGAFAPLTLDGRPYPRRYRYAAYFQVRIPRTAGWRAEAGRSRVLRLSVRG